MRPCTGFTRGTTDLGRALQGAYSGSCALWLVLILHGGERGGRRPILAVKRVLKATPPLFRVLARRVDSTSSGALICSHTHLWAFTKH